MFQLTHDNNESAREGEVVDVADDLTEADVPNENASQLEEDQDQPQTDKQVEHESSTVRVATLEDSQRPLIGDGNGPAKRTTRASKRGKSDTDYAEADLLMAMRNTLDAANDANDEVGIFVRNLAVKLRRITNPRTMLVVQNEIDQTVFRATLGVYDAPQAQSVHPPTWADPPRPAQSQQWGDYGNGQSFSEMLGNGDHNQSF